MKSYDFCECFKAYTYTITSKKQKVSALSLLHVWISFQRVVLIILIKKQNGLVYFSLQPASQKILGAILSEKLPTIILLTISWKIIIITRMPSIVALLAHAKASQLLPVIILRKRQWSRTTDVDLLQRGNQVV